MHTIIVTLTLKEKRIYIIEFQLQRSSVGGREPASRTNSFHYRKGISHAKRRKCFLSVMLIAYWRQRWLGGKASTPASGSSKIETRPTDGTIGRLHRRTDV
ncbi:hypothetical protein AVEN_219017-1 [Araneus ventricosus]|uniref:Uncharacterized protein n=1 Tax=Araneus ventricosus TaxID=182803 RepID=A0A4Y2CBU0_ARAVE|nr:hypothetical protein AVEN_219017-1 [Araneus ventricosus]